MQSRCIFLLLALIGICSAQICPNGIPEQDREIDWNRLKRTKKWYDVIEMPKPSLPIDCYDFGKIRIVQDGILVDIRGYVEGAAHDESLPTHYIRTDNGGYRISNEYRSQILANSRKVLAHISTPAMLENLEQVVDLMNHLRIYFFTDYENYLAIVSCAPKGGLMGWIKFPKEHPDGEMVAKVWSKFAELGESPTITWKKKCSDREHHQEEEEKK